MKNGAWDRSKDSTMYLKGWIALKMITEPDRHGFCNNRIDIDQLNVRPHTVLLRIIVVLSNTLMVGRLTKLLQDKVTMMVN